jgi:hypothetical protein
MFEEQASPLTLGVRQAVADPGRATAADVLALQRMVGNGAVTRLLTGAAQRPMRPAVQPTLTVGPVGDRYEQEADRVAEQVLTMPAPAGDQPSMARHHSSVQRAEDEEELQTMPLIQRAQDEEELQTMPLFQRAEDEEELQTMPLIQRAQDEEELQAKSLLQRREEGSFAVSPALEGRLASRKGGGSSLPDEIRTFMEPRFGADFGGVRVHTDNEASDIAQSLSAQAFTHGQDIYLGQGRYDPGTTTGKRLLAHELTHVIQQTGARTSHVQASQLGAGIVQRAQVLATKNQTTYEADGENVRRRRVLGTKSTGINIPRFSTFRVADNPARNDASYYKVEEPEGWSGGFAHSTNYQEVQAPPVPGTRIVAKTTRLETGTDREEALYGDILDVTGQAGDYYIGTNRRTDSDLVGSINREHVLAHEDGLAEMADPADIYVAKRSTSIYSGVDRRNKSVGVSQEALVTLQPGDKLKVNKDAQGVDRAGNTNRWVYAATVDGDQKGYVDQATVEEASEEAKAAGDDLKDAATLGKAIPFYRPQDPDRERSIGIDGTFGDFAPSGSTLEVDFGATGIDPKGGETLVFAHSTRESGSIPEDEKGYVERDQVRDVEETTRSLERQFGSVEEDVGGGPQLEQVTLNAIVSQKTALRQPHENPDGAITLKSAHQLDPGVILKHTDYSRAVFMENRAWYSEMLWQEGVLGLVDREKSKLMDQGEEDSLRLGVYRAADADLKQARVKETTHLRKILSERKHTIQIGDQFGDKIKADHVVSVDFSIRGVDDEFNFGWVYARTEKGEEGYIREEKITHEETEGKVAEAEFGGQQVQGNEIPQGNKYVATTNINVGQGIEYGDRLDPTGEAVATKDFYWGLENLRTHKAWSILKKSVMLASPALANPNPVPNREGIVTEKTTLRTPMHRRAVNVGVSPEKIAPPLLPGAKIQVDFGAAGLYKDGDTGWLYARGPGRDGYVRSDKIRESSAELLKEEEGGELPDQFLPVYVIHKTRLRDENKQKKELLKPGALVEVNFTQHPPREVQKDPNDLSLQPEMVPTPYQADADRWLLVKRDGQTRYVAEHRITAKGRAFQRDLPEGEGVPSVKGILYQAAKLLLGGVQSGAYETVGGWGVGTTGDIAEGAEGAGYSMPDVSESGAFEFKGLAVAGSIGSFMALLGAFEGLRDLLGPGRSSKERLKALLQVIESGGKGTVAVARAGENILSLQDKTSEAQGWAAVAGWAASITGAITAVKELFLAIHVWFKDKKKKDKALESARHVLEGGAAGVKAARFITKTFDLSGTNELALAVPALGLAIDLADMVLGFRRWWAGAESQRLAVEAQKTELGEEIHRGEKSKVGISRVAWDENKLLQGVVARFTADNAGNELPPDFLAQPHVSEGGKFLNQLFWKEKRGIRSLSTLYRKRRYFRVNPKILFAIRNKDNLDERREDGTLHSRSKQFISRDYYVVVDARGTRQHLVAVIVGKPVKISAETEKAVQEYEFASKVEEVSKKKKILGLEQLESSFVNLIGDALSIAGPTALAGAITKGVMAAIDAGFNFSRFLNRQWDSRRGKKYATALKYKGEIVGVDKSAIQKQREYYEHAYFIMEQIGRLASPEEIVAAAAQGRVDDYRKQYQRVQKYIEMTGVSTAHFYAYNGQPAKQVKLLVESLKER